MNAPWRLHSDEWRERLLLKDMEEAALAAAEAKLACVRGWGRLEYSGMSLTVELSWTGTWWPILK